VLADGRERPDRPTPPGAAHRARFLLPGYASLDLMRQNGESLAGRISHIDMTPLSVLEVPTDAIENLWVRGGFPDSFLAPDERHTLSWRKDLLRTYPARDVPMFGSRMSAPTLKSLHQLQGRSSTHVIRLDIADHGIHVNAFGTP